MYQPETSEYKDENEYKSKLSKLFYFIFYEHVIYCQKRDLNTGN